MDQQTQIASPLSFLVDNEAALKAADRLAQQAEAGLRFCCESGQKLTVAEGRKLDKADAVRKARFQQSMAALETRMLAAEAHDSQMESASAQVDDDADDFAEFESDDDADFSTAFALDDDSELDAEELLEIELA